MFVQRSRITVLSCLGLSCGCLNDAVAREREVPNLHDTAHDCLKTAGGARVLRLNMAEDEELDDEHFEASSESGACDGPEVRTNSFLKGRNGDMSEGGTVENTFADTALTLSM